MTDDLNKRPTRPLPLAEPLGVILAFVAVGMGLFFAAYAGLIG